MCVYVGVREKREREHVTGERRESALLCVTVCVRVHACLACVFSKLLGDEPTQLNHLYRQRTVLRREAQARAGPSVGGWVASAPSGHQHDSR